MPSLQVEQVLAIYDPAKEQEHFIRQLAFRNAKEPFGFVVPTPSRPTVAKVDGSPFAELAKRFSPEQGFGLMGLGLGGGAGSGHGATRGAQPKVTVLSKERIGSFTAFVLAASDAGALTTWLKQNQFETTTESRAWLEHYVAVGFYFTAFRYEPDAAGRGDGAEVRDGAHLVRHAAPVLPVPRSPSTPRREPERAAGARRLVRLARARRPRGAPGSDPTRAVTRAAPVGGGQRVHPGDDGERSSGRRSDRSPTSCRRAPGDAARRADLRGPEDEPPKGWGDVVLVPERRADRSTRRGARAWTRWPPRWAPARDPPASRSRCCSLPHARLTRRPSPMRATRPMARSTLATRG